MKRTTLVVLLGIPLTIAVLAGTKALQINTLMEMGETAVPPPVKVTYLAVATQQWNSHLTSIATLEANQGVDVAAESSGKVTAVHFNSGQTVKAGTLLIEQDSSTEKAQLKAAQSTLQLAKNQLKRIKKLKAEGNTSQAELDNAVAQLIRAEADIDIIQSALNKKRIVAPFTGQLGIRSINLGQELAQGQSIVNLQQLNPMLVNFHLPQRYLKHIKIGLPVEVSSTDKTTSKTLGKIIAIAPKIDSSTRNIKVQAKIDNNDKQLFPGMFVNISIDLQQTSEHLVVPNTAILYAPYGSSVFVINAQQNPSTVKQQIVKVGETRGNFIAIKEGLSGTETIVTSGAFKLSNGQTVELDNSQAPNFKTPGIIKDS